MPRPLGSGAGFADRAFNAKIYINITEKLNTISEVSELAGPRVEVSLVEPAVACRFSSVVLILVSPPSRSVGSQN
jgi:hypothetical protein